MPQHNGTPRSWRVRHTYTLRMTTTFATPLHPRRVLHGVLLLILLVGGDVAMADQPSIPDTLQQRIAACTTCHGVHGEGSSGSGFFPRLAGKPAGYLALQLQNFQRGLRKYAPMEYTVRQLSPAYMREIAAYFASQQVPYERKPVPDLSPSILQRGEQLVTTGDRALNVPPCQACHGKNLTGTEPSVPGLVGLPYDYISSQLGSWRTGTRASAAPDCMSEIANRLQPGDITAVAAWLASREVPADTHAQPAGSITPPLHCGVLEGQGGGL
jgi:cytochrome c553